MSKRRTMKDLHAKWMAEPEYAKAYNDLEEEFAIASEVVAARQSAGLSQDELAKRMQTTQSAVARVESGQHSVSVQTLLRVAEATGTRLRIKLEPIAIHEPTPAKTPRGGYAKVTAVAAKILTRKSTTKGGKTVTASALSKKHAEKMRSSSDARTVSVSALSGKKR